MSAYEFEGRVADELLAKRAVCPFRGSNRNWRIRALKVSGPVFAAAERPLGLADLSRPVPTDIAQSCLNCLQLSRVLVMRPEKRKVLTLRAAHHRKWLTSIIVLSY